MSDTLYVKKIADYYIKDEEVRQDLGETKTNLSSLVNKVNEQTNVINQHSSNINLLVESNNANSSNLSLLANNIGQMEEKIEALESLSHLSLKYDEKSETITFE